MQRQGTSGYVQPKIFTPPAPSVSSNQQVKSNKHVRFEFGPSDPEITMSGDVIPVPGEERYDFILPNAPLTEEERKYCRCLLRVEERGGARSPYAVCTARVGSQVRACSEYYDWPAMGFDILLAYMKLHNIGTAGVRDRAGALQAIGRWKFSKGESFYL
jgi:hypothetical protein